MRFLLIISLIFCTFSTHANANTILAKNGMVVSAESHATKVGADILKAGGNAVDAAVAVGFTLAVTLPRAGGLGGGGFMLVHNSKINETNAIDYRETAPKAAFRDLFLDENGAVSIEKSRYSRLAAGVPGTVAGLIKAHEMYGTMPLAYLLQPAIKYAEYGFVVGKGMEESLTEAASYMEKHETTKQIFFKEDGSIYKEGERIYQKDLAKTLRLIANDGKDAFYKGEIAKLIAADMQTNGGLITTDDLANYTVKVRKPISGDYKGYTIVSMPPPSSGGVHLIEMLNILAPFNLKQFGVNTSKTMHLMTEAMRRAYADRSKYLGDPDFVKVPTEELTNPAYAAKLRATINPNKASKSEDISPALTTPYESDQTTHFSIMDKFGNVVSNTYTLNFSYGSGIVATGTGILLNNELDDFSAKPGVPNAYGLIGGEFNAIEANKRPLSSMTPTIIFKNGTPIMATGSPGGSRIITTVLQNILNVIEHGMSLKEAVQTPRFHHQWYPDYIMVEPHMPIAVRKELEQMGHKVEQINFKMGSVSSILKTDNGFVGASDPRRPDGLAKGF